ncbi:type II toxin-antitoxin system VapC family toxin [Inquilinus sp. OTU3971]|uniref:type II toxin-antitoxin system VapC family toxin n=1 Tax=Inquilinus sp. OTU3971 TaxID=3043855 RepID=UPI00313AAC2B
MRAVLLDTHAFLWWLANDPALGRLAREVIAEPRNRIFVSAATAWEIEIKRQLGKLTAPADIEAVVEEKGFSKLPISFFHGQQAGALPPHHRDPFDRMLIAQAQAEGLELMTADPIFRAYAVRLIEAGS